MSIINAMPQLLREAGEPLPEYIQYGYAFHTLRSMLGRGRYDDAEERIVLKLYAQEAAAAGIVERVTDADIDPDVSRARYQVKVDYVRDWLRPDGSCRVHTQSGNMAWTKSPTKIAAELGVSPDVVRHAQWQLRKAG